MLRFTRHGVSGLEVVVLHGGPAAAGNAAPLARGLAAAGETVAGGGFQAIEPWQRGSDAADGDPLTVATHIADLHELIRRECAATRPALVGESWGAMLALAYAAAHPDAAGPIVLVGCGTFDPAARARFKVVLDERLGDEGRRRMRELECEFPDPADRLPRQYELIKLLYDFNPGAVEELEAADGTAALLDSGDATARQSSPVAPPPPFDVRAHEETWHDMLRLQSEGVYPSAFAAIRSPVLMLHGDYDPHPGPMIRDSLKPHIPQLEYIELARCGHSPWLERVARAGFLKILGEWLTEKAFNSDAMNERHVRGKIAEGKAAAARGEVVSHEDLKRRFTR